MKNKILLFLLLIASVTFSQEIQEKYQRAKISYNSVDDLSRLNNLGIPTDHGIHKRGYFLISDFSVSEIQNAKNAGFSVEILIEDSKEYFLEQNRLNLPDERNADCDGESGEDYETPANFSFGSMGGYLTYQEMLDELDLMKTLYPDLITTKSNISTFLTEGMPDSSTTPSIGGNGIKWVKISDNPNTSTEGEAQILYTSIHHAREPASLSQLIFYMWYLLENYSSDPEIKSILDNTELYFVPVVNPDGYLYNEKTDPSGGGFWRKNRHNGYGVDNNRNYDYYIGGDSSDNVWGGPGSSGSTSSETYRGTAPFSEKENQAIKWFVENHNFVMAFNNHTSGHLLYYPHAYANVATPEEALFQGVSSELVSKNGYTNLRDSPFSGESDDFMYGTVGTHSKIYSFTPEIGSSFWPASSQIIGICKEMMYLNITAAKMTNNYASIKDNSPLYVGNSSTINSPFDIRRLGIVGSGNFTVSINPVSANISSVGASVSFTGMNTLEESNGVIQYTIAGGTATGENIIFEYIVNNGLYNNAFLITKKYGELTTVFEDLGNSTSTNFINDGWGTTTSTFVSPSSSITDSPSGDYPNDTDEKITLSEAIDLSTAVGASVSFYAKWDIENNWDFVQFEVSTNNGASWIPQCGKYTNPGSTNPDQPTGEPLYDGTQNDWVLEEIDLGDYLGETIIARFRLKSDGFQRRDGFYFDDLTFKVIDETLGANGFETNVFTVFPNPVSDILTINTTIDEFTAEVYTIQGIKLFEAKNVTSIDYTGFSSGIYFLKITSESASETIKIIKK